MQYDKADQQNCPRRVVFYGRVSTELEAQISALKNQMNWYLELAEHHPNWTVVGQYADEGISGTGMKTRPSFMKMLRDARKKKFDLIVTREVSRFARNTVDTLVTTRELKQYGVEVYFVNDDIWTMRGDGEVRLTIMASLAQDESRKMSERTKAGIQTSQKKGTYVAGPTPFGYKRDKKAHNRINHSEEDFVLVKGDFEPIVSEVLWETCNQIRSKRAAFVKGKDGRAHKFGVSFPQNKWTKILFCDCGMRFQIEGYRVWQKKRGQTALLF